MTVSHMMSDFMMSPVNFSTPTLGATVAGRGHFR